MNRDTVTHLADRAGTDPKPPHNHEAEMALLGAVLANNLVYDSVREFLLADHFIDDRHADIYGTIGRMLDAGRTADPITLRNKYETDDRLNDVGGAAYIARLATSAVSILNAVDYAGTIKEMYLRRQLIGYAQDVEIQARDYDVDGTELAESAFARLEKVTDLGADRAEIVSLDGAARRALVSIDARCKHDVGLIGLPTGLVDLDNTMCGLQRQHLTLFAARPGMGKSTLARQIAWNVARAGTGVAYVSLEMSAEELATQQLADLSNINLQAIRRGKLNTDDFRLVMDTARQVAEIPIYFDDQPNLSVAQIKLRVRRLARRYQIGLLIVDHMALVRPEKGRSRYEEVGQISRDLKRLAKALGIPVVALVQLNRQVEYREKKRPMLADMRDSGDIEQDADNVIGIYRDHYYQKTPPEERKGETADELAARRKAWYDDENVAELIVLKQRMGPLTTVRVHYDGTHSRFRNLSQNEQESTEEFIL